MTPFRPTTALLQYTMARLDVLSDSSQPFENVTYQGVTIRLMSEDQYGSTTDPDALFDEIEPLAHFSTGDPVSDFSAALLAARSLVGAELGRLEVASSSADFFVRESRDFCWAKSDECQGDLTLRRVERTLESQAQSRHIVEKLTVPGEFDCDMKGLWDHYQIMSVEETYRDATSDFVREIIYRLAKEAGTYVIAEREVSKYNARNLFRLHDCLTRAAAQRHDGSDEERQELVERWINYPGAAYIKIDGLDDIEESCKSFWLVPIEEMKIFIAWCTADMPRDQKTSGYLDSSPDQKAGKDNGQA